MPQGTYADGRTFTLPTPWVPVAQSVFAGATSQALAALGALAGADRDRVREGLVAYFNPDGKYAGALFNAIAGTECAPDEITAADLLAVSTLRPLTHARSGDCSFSRTSALR